MQPRAWEEAFHLLAAPFHPDDLEWRLGSTYGDKGQALVYVTNRAVMERLDQVLGPTNWSEEYRKVRENSKGWICQLSITVMGHDGAPQMVVHEDAADESDIEPTKGGASDSMKRAAVKFGIGRYLYNMPIQWAPLDTSGKRPKFAKGWRPDVPVWARPGGPGRPPSGQGAAHAAPPAQAKPEPPVPRLTPPKAQAQAAASSNRDQERPDPDTGLPPGSPPFDILRPIQFGKFKGMPWDHLARGSIGGRRHGWLQWYVENGDVKQESHKQARVLLEWMSQKAIAEELKAEAKRDHTLADEPGHLTDAELAGESQGEYVEGVLPWADAPDDTPF